MRAGLMPIDWVRPARSFTRDKIGFSDRIRKPPTRQPIALFVNNPEHSKWPTAGRPPDSDRAINARLSLRFRPAS